MPIITDVFYLYLMRECLMKEVSYKTSRSSGPGGQHVNRTESRVELYWHSAESVCLNVFQLNLIRQRLGSRLTEKGLLIMTCDKHRSQHQNKQEVNERFLRLISISLVPVKKRHPTRPTRSSIEKRISNKKKRGDLKRSRRSRTDE